jgi:hypothetical protein
MINEKLEKELELAEREEAARIDEQIAMLNQRYEILKNDSSPEAKIELAATIRVRQKWIATRHARIASVRAAVLLSKMRDISAPSVFAKKLAPDEMIKSSEKSAEEIMLEDQKHEDYLEFIKD